MKKSLSVLISPPKIMSFGEVISGWFKESAMGMKDNYPDLETGSQL